MLVFFFFCCSMKRSRDEGCDGASFKRPFGSSRGESSLVFFSLVHSCIWDCFDVTELFGWIFFFFEFVEFLLILDKSLIFSCCMIYGVCKFVIRWFSVIPKHLQWLSVRNGDKDWIFTPCYVCLGEFCLVFVCVLVHFRAKAINLPT